MSEDNPIWTVIMAGGVGSRFWPLSRRARPKQTLHHRFMPVVHCNPQRCCAAELLCLRGPRARRTSGAQKVTCADHDAGSLAGSLTDSARIVYVKPFVGLGIAVVINFITTKLFTTRGVNARDTAGRSTPISAAYCDADLVARADSVFAEFV